jgi:predicted dehydrogenase
LKKTNRRDFLSNGATLVTAASAFPLYSFKGEKANAGGVKKRVAMIGTGNRGARTWGVPVVKELSNYIEFVGLCDINRKRIEVAKKMMEIKVKSYVSRDFELMIEETKPEVVIVTTTDSFHWKYIVRALELGCDVISEKPIATEAAQCQQIVDAEKRSGKKVYVGFNVRYMNSSVEMKKILMSGELGKIISIDYQENLNTSHGADYFRRWHGKIKYSGSLLVHKASHQFDLINWLIDAEPVDVQAIGKVAFYGSNNGFRARNCRNCSFTKECKFYWDINSSEFDVNMYANCEDVDGYYRDGCVWDNEIDSFDTSSVLVNYNNGTQMSFSMNAFLPFEGQFICFSGEYGRLEVRLNDQQSWEVPGQAEFRLSSDMKTSRYWTVNATEGGHGGADGRIRERMFLPESADTLGQTAGSRAGVLSSLIGIAARKSIETGQKVLIADLITFPGEK